MCHISGDVVEPVRGPVQGHVHEDVYRNVPRTSRYTLVHGVSVDVRMGVNGHDSLAGAAY